MNKNGDICGRLILLRLYYRHYSYLRGRWPFYNEFPMFDTILSGLNENPKF